jgi:parvulin-like peptidyl-prolyl isomerase
MTFRARPVTRRPSRAGWDPDDRRTALINGGFLGAIVLSVIILIGYAGWTWYSDHFGAAATVDGQSITRDQLRQRIDIENFRIGYTESRIRDLQTAGQITAAQAQQQLSYLDDRRNSVESIALERLIDITLQAKLATDAGITVADPEIDEQITSEATLEEQRHVWMIEVEPAVDPASGQVTETEKAAAKKKADDALAQLKAGTSWEDVAKTASTAASAPQAGDLSWLPKESGYDAKFMDSVFAVAQDTPTDVVVGDDGTYRIGRVTEIAPKSVDGAFTVKVEDAGIKIADYREAVKADVVRKKLSDKVVADLSKPSLQRHVLQIFLPEVQAQPDGVKVRHILFSPNDDPNTATTLPINDPAWTKAKDEAQAVYEELLKDPTRFDELARTKSDEGSAKQTGGKQPFYDPTSAIDNVFATAIFKEGLKPGDIIPPFRSVFGWHIVQFMRPWGDGQQAWMDTLKEQADGGADFAQLARDQGEGDEGQKGGDIGWIVQGQLGDLKEGQIFETTVGEVSDVLAIPNEGIYLFKVLAEETRTPDAAQIKVFEDSGFSTWYADKKAAAKIDRNVGSSAATS